MVSTGFFKVMFALLVGNKMVIQAEVMAQLWCAE